MQMNWAATSRHAWAPNVSDAPIDQKEVNCPVAMHENTHMGVSSEYELICPL